MVGNGNSCPSKSVNGGLVMKADTSRTFFTHWSTRLAIRVLFYVLSFIMIVSFFLLGTWRIGRDPSAERHILDMVAKGGFTNSPLLDAEGRPTLLRYASSPGGRYLHILPSGLWSAIAPVQLNPYLRSKFPTAHRWLGRSFVAMSVSIGVGVLCLARSGATNANFNRLSTGGPLVLLVIYFLATAALAIYHAMKKRMITHRIWMLRHVAVGYSVHLQRLLIGLTMNYLPLFIPHYADLTEAGAHIRGVVFAAYFHLSLLLCVVAMEVWLYFSSYSLSLPRAPEKKA